MSAHLRFGIVCSGTVLPAWQAACVRELLAVEGLELGVVLVADAGPEPRSDLPRRAMRWYQDAYVARRARSARLVRLVEELSGVPSDEIGGAADVTRVIERHHVDFVVQLDGPPLGPFPDDVLPHGVWRFDGADSHVAIATGEAVATVRIVRARGAGVEELHRGVFRTAAHSLARHLDAVRFGSSDLPARVARELLVRGRLSPQPLASMEVGTGGLQVARFAGRSAVGFARRQWRELMFAEHWNIGVIDAPIATLVSGDPPPVRWWPPTPKSSFVADPFAVETPSGLVGLVEEYDHRRREPRIVAVRQASGCEPERLGAISGFDVHGSYPFLLEHDGEVLCIPEQQRTGEVRLYRAVELPLRWERVATLLAGVSVSDPTIVRHDGRWWLFGVDHARGNHTKLCAWYADDLYGPWAPHPLNPLKTDVRSSRPAGTPFHVDGELFRPAMDCSRTYGGRVVINRVRSLSPVDFDEEPCAAVEPDPSGPCPDGLHTLASVGPVTLVDGKRHRFVWSSFAHEAAGRIRVLPRRRRRREPPTDSDALQ